MDPVVLSLWHALSEAMALGFRAAPAREVRLTPSAALVLTGEPAGFNFALIFGGAQPADQLRAFSQVAQERSLPLLVMVAEELADDLAPAARDLGLDHVGSMPFMVHRPQASGAAPPPYQIVRVDDEQDLLTSNTLAAGAFGYPVALRNRVFGPMTLEAPGVEGFLARRDGVPVSTVWTVRGGRRVGVFDMATPPEHQRQGAGHTLITQVIAWHYDRGAKLFYLQATEAGYALYERIGFQTVAKASVWRVAGPATQVDG